MELYIPGTRTVNHKDFINIVVNNASHVFMCNQLVDGVYCNNAESSSSNII